MEARRIQSKKPRVLELRGEQPVSWPPCLAPGPDPHQQLQHDLDTFVVPERKLTVLRTERLADYAFSFCSHTYADVGRHTEKELQGGCSDSR